MIVDTSALAAVLFAESGHDALVDRLAVADRCLMSAVNALEIGIVVEARLGEAGGRELSALLEALQVDVVAFDAGLAAVALDAWRRYGKGRHPAGLNFGDCAAYALAKVTNQSLLFQGEDFSKTDLASALS